MDEYRKYEPIFGSWYLSKLIGKGSFGKVYEIVREEYGTTYRAALKIITVPQDDDDIKARMTEESGIESVTEYYEDILKEIVNENEIMAKLKGNSHIVSYEDHQIIPHEDGIGYDILIRMELLTPLLDRMMQKKLDEKEVVKLGIDMCKALELCHRKNIIHRDIKPQNIFISDSGDYKLGDFGIARTMEKTTGGMSKKGTYKYMAPEVFRGEHYDSTVDLYSLGIVLFSLLNGNRGPFLPAPPAKVTANEEEEARMRRFRGEPIPSPKDAGVMLSYIIKKACEADPSRRYRTAEQMRRDLESYLSNYEELSVSLPAGFDNERTAIDYDARRYTGSVPPVQQSRMTGQYTGQYTIPPQYGAQGQYGTQSPYGTQAGYTGQYSMPPQYGAQAQYGGAAGPVQPREVSGKSGSGKGLKIAAIILATLVLAGGVTFALTKILGGGSDDDGGGETPPVTPPVADEDPWPDEAVEWNGHHYMVYSDSMTWDDAEDACEARGGHLACIENASEQSFIETLIEDSYSSKKHFWLGGYMEDGSWWWVTGDAIPDPTQGDNWGYENWERNKKGNPDKPNNNTDEAAFTGTESCLEIQTTDNGYDYMTWNDIDRDGNTINYRESPEYNSQKYFGYICEWDG